MAQQKPTNKESVSDSKYQSTFMPIFQNAETRIKVIIILALFYGTALLIVRKQLAEVIKDVERKIPNEMIDKESYVKGLKYSTFRMLDTFLIKQRNIQKRFIKDYNETHPNDPVHNVFELNDKTKTQAGRKGYPYSDYQKDLKRYYKELTNEEIKTDPSKKRPITLWQKAELDVRYDKQMNMLDNLDKDGVQLAYISSHVDCSKRCERWQGKLMSLHEHAQMDGFRVRKYKGQWVYSLTDIMAQTDKYGYRNNVICGFNCRHKLIPYQEGSVAPQKFDSGEVAKERTIAERCRAMERAIRKVKTDALLQEKVGNVRASRELKAKANAMTQKYKAFCEKNNFAWYEYRIQI